MLGYAHCYLEWPLECNPVQQFAILLSWVEAVTIFNTSYNTQRDYESEWFKEQYVDVRGQVELSHVEGMEISGGNEGMDVPTEYGGWDQQVQEELGQVGIGHGGWVERSWV